MNLERMKEAAISHYRDDEEAVYAVVCTDGDMIPATGHVEAVDRLRDLLAGRDDVVDVTADDCPHRWEYGIVRVDVERKTSQEDSQP